MSALRLEIGNARRILVSEGPRAVFRRYGWKAVAAIFAYYLVRDVTLYVILPLLVFKSF